MSTTQTTAPSTGAIVTGAGTGAGIRGEAREPRRPFKKYFRETGWRHLVGIVAAIAIFSFRKTKALEDLN
jgi:arabinogalactan oligomer/maltooligosaccharide transport system permease protein